MQNADVISQLPDDKTQPSHNEIQIVNTLFKKHGGYKKSFISESKDLLIIGILFILFSLPQTDVLLKKFLPQTESIYILLSVKAAALAISYWVIKHFCLAKK